MLSVVTTDPFLNTCGVSDVGLEEHKSLLSTNKHAQEDCSCGIAAILESRSQKAIKQGNRLIAGISVPMGKYYFSLYDLGEAARFVGNK